MSMGLHGADTLCPDMPRAAAPDREPSNRVSVDQPTPWLAQQSALLAGQGLLDADESGPATGATRDRGAVQTHATTLLTDITENVEHEGPSKTTRLAEALHSPKMSGDARSGERVVLFTIAQPEVLCDSDLERHAMTVPHAAVTTWDGSGRAEGLKVGKRTPLPKQGRRTYADRLLFAPVPPGLECFRRRGLIPCIFSTKDRNDFSC